MCVCYLSWLERQGSIRVQLIVAMGSVVAHEQHQHRRKRSKKGCLTCKVRKKGCSEDRPVCKDCARLKLECVYPDNLSKDQIRGAKVRLQTVLKKKNLRALLMSNDDVRDGTMPGFVVDVDAGVSDVDVSEAQAQAQVQAVPRLSEMSPSMLDMVLNDFCVGDNSSTEAAMSPVFSPLDKDQDEGAMVVVNSVAHSHAGLGNASDSPEREDPLFKQYTPTNSNAIISSSHTDPYMSQPLTEPLLQQLDATGIHLYNYYRDHLAQVICIAPARQNFYLQCFLPMAHKHRGILYGILAWSAHHLSISQAAPALDEGSSTRLIMDKDSHFSKLANNYTLGSLQCLNEPQQQQKDSPSFLYSLAQILVLCGAEICQGDVNRWQILLKTAAKLIKEHIGGTDLISLLKSDNHSGFDAIDLMTRNWLLANFIYHDIMGSQTTKFPMVQYERLLLSSSGSFTDWSLQVDSLHGLNRPIFKVLGETTNLIRQMKAEKINLYSSNFKAIMFNALDLNQQLLTMAPDEQGLALLAHSTDEIDYRELSKHLFEIFRLSALIHLKTNVLKVENNTFEVSFYTKTLLSKLDLVLGTKLESSLCFPMFICGINCLEHDREIIESKFIRYISTYKCRNVVRAHDIMHSVWKMDDEGESIGSSGIRERDWIDICDDMGWDISFA